MSLFRQDVLKGKVAFVTGGDSGICKAVALFLCTDAASLVHGAVVVADGGQYLAGTAAMMMTT